MPIEFNRWERKECTVRIKPLKKEIPENYSIGNAFGIIWKGILCPENERKVPKKIEPEKERWNNIGFSVIKKQRKGYPEIQ